MNQASADQPGNPQERENAFEGVPKLGTLALTIVPDSGQAGPMVAHVSISSSGEFWLFTGVRQGIGGVGVYQAGSAV